MPEADRNPADVAFKALQDARAKLKAAGVEYYVIVAWDGYTADDGSVSADNAQSVVQRLDLVARKYRREFPQLSAIAAE